MLTRIRAWPRSVIAAAWAAAPLQNTARIQECCSLELLKNASLTDSTEFRVTKTKFSFVFFISPTICREQLVSSFRPQWVDCAWTKEDLSNSTGNWSEKKVSRFCLYFFTPLWKLLAKKATEYESKCSRKEVSFYDWIYCSALQICIFCTDCTFNFQSQYN